MTACLTTILLIVFNLQAIMRTSLPASTAGTGRHLIAVQDFSGWMQTDGGSSGEIVLISPEMETPILWNELVVSWNVDAPVDTTVKIEARALYEDRATKYYVLGLWSPDDSRRPRESVNGQKDADGDVKTDTLALNCPTAKAQVQVTLGGPDEKTRPTLKLLTISFLDTEIKNPPRKPNRAAWGKALPVPERSQLAYDGGRGWCSPACTSMALAYWAKKLNRPELDRDVPEVAKGVYDKNWPGTGNWPFNTAFAGALPGMRAYVTRLGDVSELEEWIAAGVPVILSVSYALLKGKPTPEAGGISSSARALRGRAT
jgi:hypothetical protein